MPGWPVVDSVQFARQHSSIRRSVAVSEFKRLAQAVADEDTRFQVVLEGFEDSDGKPGLHLRVAGEAHVACQRCLEPMVLAIDSERSFLLVEQERDLMQLVDEADDVDSLLADSKMDVRALAEDEILLQIPIAPRHAEGACDRPAWSGEDSNAGSAFAVLGSLTNSKD